MKNIILAVTLMLLATGETVLAQHQEVPEKPEMYKGKEVRTDDTTSLLSAFKRGQTNGHFRYFFMATDNKRGLTDYYANAAGGGIRFETAKFHGFQFAVSGFYIFNIGSSDLTLADSTTGQLNRYETALFDIEDPANKKDIDRLEEFYLRYNYKNSNLVAGRQLINTPFINLQDGRMRATGVEGIWAEFNELKKTKIEGGWLYAISPRGTTKWYNTGESIGIYPVGLNLDGTRSAYQNSIESKSAALLGISTSLENLKLQVWDLFSENVFNTTMLQADLMYPLKNKSSAFASAQLIRQDAVNDGGNPDAAKTYFEKGGKAITFGAKAGWRNALLDASVNYNRITAHGRYLMPREWGREPFFTFLPRERNEGFGDVHAFMAKVNYNIPRSGIKTSLAGGYYQMPDVKNYKLNKYGLPSYTQVNGDVQYSFTGTFKGLEAQFLISGKVNNGETYNNTRYEINKVNMLQYNFVLNYHF
ncbi:OprD family outer membrane porin [Daejeonella sp.]|uniref:OprD family outer membrane porin n=1 Tax=Daejeonella sp. TaxID=2805397 RepID=UPI003983D735